MVNNITCIPYELCVGCKNCEKVCKNNCIFMVEQQDGFSYPQIDDKRCTKCGMCKSVCPVLKSHDENYERKGYFACYSKDEAIVDSSTSGGAFSVLANYVLSQNGVVFGAAFDEQFQVLHVAVSDQRNLNKLRKSKYVQSDLNDTFIRIKELLLNNIRVLFSGTPCQIKALYAYLGQDYDELVTVEVFCGSVSSPLVWKRYCIDLEKKFKSSITEVDFRYKKKKTMDNQLNGISKYGWKAPMLRITFESGEVYECEMEKDPYFDGYKTGLTARKSCYVCNYRFSENYSGADFSIGDYWGIENAHPEMKSENGVSALMVNTFKAMDIFELIKESLCYVDSTMKKIAQNNRPSFYSIFNKRESEKRDIFYKQLYDSHEQVKDLIRGNLNAVLRLDNDISIGLWGSYNSRRAINIMIDYTNNQFVFQYCNSSLVSLFSNSIELEITNYPTNNFRKEMLLADVNKTFRIENFVSHLDVLVIDFLEERFSVLEINGSVYTESDAYCDAEILATNARRLDEEEFVKRWKWAADQFFDLIEHKFAKAKVVLIEMYLSEKYDKDGTVICFEDICRIRQINARLKTLYEYVRVKHKNIQRIIIKPEDYWCESKHIHGVKPCHLNARTYEKLAYNLANKIIMEMEK